MVGLQISIVGKRVQLSTNNWVSLEGIYCRRPAMVAKREIQEAS